MYKPFVKEDIEQFKQLLEGNDNWKEILDKNGTKIFATPNQKGMKFKMISTTFKDYEPVDLFSMGFDKEFMKTLSEHGEIFSEVINQIDCTQEVIHRVTKMPLMDPRDFVIQTIRYHNKDNTEFISYSKSVENDIPLYKNSIRAIIYFQGILIRKTPEGTMYYMASHIDMGGKMPSGGETMLKTMGKKMPKKVKENAEKYKKFNEANKNRPMPWLETVEWMNE